MDYFKCILGSNFKMKKYLGTLKDKQDKYYSLCKMYNYK